MMKVLLVLFLGAVIVVTVAQTAAENSTSDEDNTEVIDKCEYPAACDNCAQQVENVRSRDIYIKIILLSTHCRLLSTA